MPLLRKVCFLPAHGQHSPYPRKSCRVAQGEEGSERTVGELCAYPLV